MRQKTTYKPRNLILFLLLAMFFCALSVAVGHRDITVGTDTANYTNIFNSIEYTFETSRIEFLFKYLTYGIKFFEVSLEIYFAILFVLFNFLYLFSYFRAAGQNRKVEELFILIGLMFSSSWYLVATLNGLRQGLSLPLLYLSLLCFSERKFIFSIFFIVASLGFHKSVILALPFFFLVFFRARFVFLFFVFSSGLYLFGISESLVFLISNALGVSLYNDISDFGAEANNWVGFQADFFGYSLFWFFFLFFLRRYVKQKYLDDYLKLWKFYCVLIMPYFYFGFGGYSNRYAFIGWLFLPLIQAFFIASSKIENKFKFLLAFIFFSVGFFPYLYYVLNF